MALGFGVISLATVLFGMTTHSRRRRTWGVVAGLVLLTSEFIPLYSIYGISEIVLHTASCQIAAFTLVTDSYYKNAFQFFEHARPGEF